MFVRDAASAPAHALGFQRALETAGIPFLGALDPKLEQGVLAVIVGNKPL